MDNITDNQNKNIYKYSTEWIKSLEPERHWQHYWNQQKVMEGLIKPGQHILEIGIGSGFTANYLRSKGYKVTTIDIDKDKRPDIVANIVDYDFSEEYDHIIAFEVFEHMPFEEFQKVLKRIKRACKNYLFLSVPVNEKIWLEVNFKVPVLGNFSFVISTRRNKLTADFHFWEIRYKKYSRKKLDKEFESAGFQINQRKKVFLAYYYILKSM